MNIRQILIPVWFLGLLMLSSCEQVEEKGLLKFGLEMTEEAALKAASTDNNVTMALVSIQSANGTIVFDKEPLELLRFGDQFVTASLQIPVGEYILTEFMLMDAGGVILWATPMEGSTLAHLVRNPLPHYFGIQHDQTTNLDIQVVRVGDHLPGDFGYAEFHIGFVNHFCLMVQYDFYCEDNWRDSVIGPDGSAWPYYQPRLVIMAGNRYLMDQPLNGGLNWYEVPLGFERYELSAVNCHADTFYRQVFSLNELSQYNCGPNSMPLVISNGTDPEIIITPEDLYEPTIRQGVFGSISLPYLDSYMTENRCNIWPVIRDIYFYPYYVLDSIYTQAPIDCYFPMEMIATEPVAIVRTNSSGIFQVPLEAGAYLYLVKTDGGYYIDAYISSHLPGQVVVYPGEVTKLSINMIDCSMWM
jgi:hypothetical protein